MYATSLISEQTPALSVEIPTLGLMAWQDVLMKLRARLDPKRHTFVSHLRLGGLEKGTVKLLVPSDFLRGWVNSYYKGMLLDLWQEQMPEISRVEVATHGGQVIVNPISSMKGVYLTGKPARRPPLRIARKKAAEPPVAVQEVPLRAQSLEQMHEAFALRIWVDTIISEVCRFYKLTRKEMLTGGRAYRIVGPRQKAMYLAHVLTQRSLPEIGKDFGREGGKFDHTTVLHAARKIAAMREADNLVDREVTYLASLIMERTMLEKTGVTMLHEEQATAC